MKEKSFKDSKLFSLLKVVLAIIIIALIVYEGKNELKSINIAETFKLLRSFSIFSSFGLMLFGLISVLAISLYDLIIVNYLKLDIKKLTVLNYSFLANTVNNISGMGALTGTSIRTVYLNKKANNVKDIIDYNLLLIPSAGIGLSIFSIWSLLNYNTVSYVISEYRWLFLALVGFSLYIIPYFLVDILTNLFKKQKYEFEHLERFKVRFKLLVASFLEWSMVIAFFITLVRQFDNSVSATYIIGIFSIAIMAGVISLLPGGIGSFDLVVMLGLTNIGVESENVLAVLILFRMFYYIIPLFLGLIFTLVIPFINTFISSKNRFKSTIKEYIDLSSGISNILLSILIFTSGSVLLFSALTPSLTERVKIAQKVLSLPILKWSHEISILIGILLISISKEIWKKVKRSYKITQWLIILGAIFTFIKGLDYEEAIFLLIISMLLRMSKNSFYRISVPFNLKNFIINIILALIGIMIYFKISHIIILEFLKKDLLIFVYNKTRIEFLKSVLLSYVVFLAYYIYMNISKKNIEQDPRYEKLDEDKLKKFLTDYKGNSFTHLIYLKDKHLFWPSSGKILISFERSNHIAVVLGDPIGHKDYIKEGLKEFMEFIDLYGLKSAFYEISEEYLPIYHELGYYFFKLGEEALIDLGKFELVGSKHKDFRNVLSRFQKDKYSFEILQNPFEESFLKEIKNISDSWLAGREEMSFSLGCFNRDYLNRAPIAIVKHDETNEIVAFASLLPSYDDNNSISIDLMRYKPNSPNNLMTFLILKLILYYKEEGYHYFNLGVAPLSNVGDIKYSHYQEKLARLVYKYGKRIYSFQGLRKYKEKFGPDWYSKYLAYENIIILPDSLIGVSRLINKRKKNIYREDIEKI